MLHVAMLCAVYAECPENKYCFSGFYIFIVMLSVVMPSVVILSDAAPRQLRINKQ
jgi:hypothetical protein